MLVKDIIEKLEELSPLNYACDWDNVGLILGSKNSEVKKILIALDLHNDLVEQAIKENVDLVITHHPMIFKGLKQINDDNFVSSKILMLITNSINVYAMHTNFDVCGSMAEVAAKKLWLSDLEVLTPTNDDGKGLGVIGNMAHLNLRSFSFVVKDTFKLDNIKVYGNLNHLIHRVAILPGSGRSSIDDAIKKGADVMITGDITHHDGVDATDRGLKIIDAGHYGIEKIFIDFIANYISENFEGLEIIKEEEKELFNWL